MSDHHDHSSHEHIVNERSDTANHLLQSRAFKLAIIFNLLFVVVEFSFGYWSESLSLVGDAAHNLSDVGSLALSWLALVLMQIKVSPKFNFGFGKFSIIVAFFNSIVLVFTCLWIIHEAIERFRNPQVTNGFTMMVVAGIGFLINFFTARLFHQGHEHGHHQDLNSKSAYLHLIGDALISLGVVVSGLLILWLQWTWIDPVVSFIIALIIAVTTWPVLKESCLMLFQAVPKHIKYDEVKREIELIEPNLSVTDLKIWNLSTIDTAAIITTDAPANLHLHVEDIKNKLRNKFGFRLVVLEVSHKHD